MKFPRYTKHIIVSVLIIGVIVPVIFFSFDSSPKNEIEIELWYTYEGRGVIEEKIKDYEALNPSIKIIFTEQPSSGWLDKFISVAQTGDAPDIFLAKGSWYGELAELGYIEPLSSFLNPTLEARYLPQAITGLTYKNQIWGLPLWFDSILLFYNKDMFDAKGVEYPLTNWTDINLLEKALELTDRSINQEYGLVWATISPYMWPAFQYGFGHGELYQDGSIIINDTASYNAVKFIYDLKYFYRCVDYDENSFSATQAFVTNKGAMLIYGGWYIPTLNEESINYGVQVLPKINVTNENITPMVEIKGWGISKDADEKDICFDIITYLSGKEVQQELIEQEYKVPTNLELIKSPLVTDNVLIQKQIDQIENSQFYPLDPIYNIYSDYMRAALQFTLLDHVDIQIALNQAQAGIYANS